ncbi:MAG TPA: glycosyltransferase family 2 protein [Candidatus Kapabacteria bacterium]|nr:glycosyltransferase family 2 protein [Candidatus Kapabacteria bacterium]
MTDVSIVIPAYKEEDRLSASLHKIIQYFDSTLYRYEIIVVDDGSKDRTAEIASSFSNVKVLVQEQNQGKGAAVRRGMLYASGSFRLFSDADLSTPIYEFERLYSQFQDGYDIVIGNRALDYSMIKVHQPFYREFMGKMFNKIVQALVVKGISDTQCGFKGMSAKAAQDIFSRSKIDGFGFDVEMLFIANSLNYKIQQVAVEWYNDDRSKVSPIKDSIKMFNEILRIRRLHK